MRFELQYIYLQFTQNHISKHAINFGYIWRLDFYLYQRLQWLVWHIKPKPRAPMFNIWTFAKIIDFMDPPHFARNTIFTSRKTDYTIIIFEISAFQWYMTFLLSRSPLWEIFDSYKQLFFLWRFLVSLHCRLKTLFY